MEFNKRNNKTKDKSKSTELNEKEEKSGFKKFINKDSVKELVIWGAVSLAVLILAEIFAWGGTSGLSTFLGDRTKAAALNMLIILLMTGLVIFLKRKKAFLCVITFLVLAISIVNGCMMTFRGMPIAFSDIFSLADGISIASQFITIPMFVELIIGVVLFVALTIFLWKKDKDGKRITGYSNIVAYLMVIGVLFASWGLTKTDYMGKLGWDVGQSYKNNGFIYSVIDSYIGYRRKEPENYSKENVENIRAEVEKRAARDKTKLKSEKDRPNVLFVQLEGFMDPTQIPGVEISQDPIPEFRKISKKFTSGYMNMPTTGGGTARTEFEMYTGNSFKYLLDGEIPYVTIVKNKPGNSIATYLKSQGYGAHALHDFEGNFYSREKGIQNLGYDTFTSFEYMNGIELNEKNWPKDKILTTYINKALDSTKDKKDLVSTISVQGHSKYPDNIVSPEWPCKVTGTLPQNYLNEITYYTEQAREMDEFVGDLNKSLMERKKKTGEDTVVVYYGDHMPKINYLYDEGTGDKLPKYQAPYTFFATYDIPKENISPSTYTALGEEDKCKFSAYQVGAKLLEYAGTGYGPMEKFHKYMKDDSDYMEKLELVEYDVLFGEKYYLKENEIQKENTIKMGIDDIKINNAKLENGKLIVEGQNFTPKSAVFVGKERLETTFVSPERLEAEFEDTKGEVTVGQIGKNDVVLSKTEEFELK